MENCHGQVVWYPPLAVSYFAVIFWGDVISRDTLEIQLAFPAAFAGLIPTDTPQIDMRLPNGDTLTQTATRTQIIAPGSTSTAPHCLQPMAALSRSFLMRLISL